MKIEMFKHGLCEGVMSPLTECFLGIDIMPDWGIFTLPSTVKPKPVDEVQKACKSTLQAILIGHAK